MFNMEFGKKINKARVERGMTLSKLGDLVGISESTVQRYEKGLIKNIDINKVVSFAKALHISAVYLMGWDENEEYYNLITIPVYGSIPAGVPLEAVEDIQGEVKIPTSRLHGENEYIALKVEGDSMYPKYLEGDTAIIKIQSCFDNGQDCACYVNGYHATLKRAAMTNDGIKLTPLNPNYPPRTYSKGEVEILGVVKEIRREV